MSSHHIVREKQEPALLIMSLAGFNQEYLGQLLEWSPTVVVNENSYIPVDEAGIKIDGVITANPEFAGQHSTRVILTESSPLEDGLKYLIGEQYQAVSVIADDFSLKDYGLIAELITISVYTPQKKIFAIKSGFSKWQVAGHQIELLHEATNLNFSGLKYVSEHKLETLKDGFYSLCFEQPFIFIAENL